ncbi:MULTISPECIES: YceD family protein [Anaerostipes]|uniref:YceD family protein n=1 Tax=Anaerostipes TaxID=207244 RepID=UPI000951E15E|nr:MULTISPECIES: DUF177 domain-containing protein [unclassified Anaerostipes]MCI5623539.1 DUF177 domain-containing protein [Anaerostipes sp.]MDY2726835.1 DUF177 domain-containing protein [Anaerostipes faecalis]OLR58833.1 nucleic acid-binding protein [Anaerostipes sp. 494a]
MKLQLSKFISTPNYAETQEAYVDMDEIKLKGVSYPIRKKDKFPVTFQNTGKNTVSWSFKTEMILGIPCDRCLDEVLYTVTVDVMEEVDFDHLNQEDGEFSYIEDRELDMDLLIFDEVVPKLPSKLLCREDCKGLCPVCGTNLNKKECGCDRTVADPRMAAIQDIFKNFKEV